MATFASDSFTGTEDTELSAYDASWIKVTGNTGNAEIASNRVRASGTTFTAYYYNATPPSADYPVQATIHTVTSVTNATAGVLGRVSSSANTFYQANAHATSGWQLFKRVAGTATQLGSSVAQTYTAGQSYDVKLSMSGTTIELYKLGESTAAISVTDSAISAAGFAGLRFSSPTVPSDTSNFHIDDWSAGEAGGTTYNQSLTANASGSASFARAVQAIKSASATSAAITERLIAIQRSASGAGSASLVSSKSVLRTVDATATGSPALSRVVGMLRSASSAGSAAYSRTVGLLRSVTGTGTATLTGPAAPQFLRPDGNITQTSFTGGFAEIDEASASDADFAYGANNVAAVLEVSLSNPTGAPASGTTTVRYRIAKTNAGTVDGGGNAVTVTAAVYQGTTLIASDSAQTATGTWTQYSWAPSMASVTDWNDLRLRFTTSASGGTAANRRGGAVSWAEVEAPAAGATTFNQALTATSTAAASFLRSIGRAASASASGAASFLRSAGKSASASASGAASYLRGVLLARDANSTGSATLNAARAFLKELTANSTGAATLATAVAVAITLSAAATGSALLVASVGLLIVASAIGTASASRVIGLVRSATSAATATVQRGLTMGLSVVSSVVAALVKFASTAGTSLARMLSISAESRIHTPNAENRIRTMDGENRDLTP